MYNQRTDNMDTYIRELRSRISHCEYGELGDSFLCDRLVRCKTTRNGLLQTPNITLKQCEEMCRLSENRTSVLTAGNSTSKHEVDEIGFLHSLSFTNSFPIELIRVAT